VIQKGTVPFGSTPKARVGKVAQNGTVPFWATLKTRALAQNNDEATAQANVITPESEIPEARPDIVKKTVLVAAGALLKGLKP